MVGKKIACIHGLRSEGVRHILEIFIRSCNFTNVTKCATCLVGKFVSVRETGDELLNVPPGEFYEKKQKNSLT